MKGRVRLSNLTLVNGVLEADCELLADATPTTEPTPVPVPPQPRALPLGFDSDPSVGYGMLVTAMDAHGLTPVGVQGHGQQIVEAMNASWPGWNVYLSPSDAPIVPGFGSIDVTIDSGKGGWQFRKDGVTPYAR